MHVGSPHREPRSARSDRTRVERSPRCLCEVRQSCWSASTPVARSPTSSPTTGRSSRSRRRRRDPARPCAHALEADGGCPARAARARHDGRDERAARAARRARRAGHDARLRRRDRDRPPGPAVAVRPARRPARAARAARPAVRGGRPARRATAASSSRSTATVPDDPGRRRRGRRVPAARRSRTRAHEQAVAAVLRGRGIDVTCSHEVSPEFREYERMVTTVANADAAAPVPGRTSGRSPRLADEVLVMTSAGGLVPADDAAELPAALLLSGPAGGVRAAAARGRRVRVPRRGRLRHGWHEHRRVPRAGRRARARTGARRRRLPDPAAVARRPHDRRGRRFDRAPRRGRCARRRAARAPAQSRARPATGAVAGPSRRSPTPTSCSGASIPTPRSPDSGRLDVAAATEALARAGVDRRRRRRRRRRRDGGGRARGDRRAGRRPARPRARRVRRRGTAARVRGRRRARHARR